jgi:membrane protein
VYWPLVTLGPILLGLSLSISAAVEANATVRWLRQVAPVLTLLAAVIPLVLTWIFFTFLYAVMPNTKVPVRFAAVGGLVAATLWVSAQKLYALYAANAIAYSAIYGSLGAVPLFILWIYVSWIVALLGAQLTFAAQTHATYEPESEKRKKVPQRDREFLAARLLMAVSRGYEQGMGSVSTDELVNRLLVPARLARQVLNDLVAARLLVESEAGFVPGRPLDRISVADVISVMRGGDGEVLIGEDPLSQHVGKKLLDAEGVLERELGSTTLAEMLAKFDEERAAG